MFMYRCTVASAADLCLLSSHKSEIQSVHSCISFLPQSHVLAQHNSQHLNSVNVTWNLNELRQRFHECNSEIETF